MRCSRTDYPPILSRNDYIRQESDPYFATGPSQRFCGSVVFRARTRVPGRVIVRDGERPPVVHQNRIEYLAHGHHRPVDRSLADAYHLLQTVCTVADEHNHALAAEPVEFLTGDPRHIVGPTQLLSGTVDVLGPLTEPERSDERRRLRFPNAWPARQLLETG